MNEWSNRCEKSIDKERMEVEERYQIKIKPTSISCQKCGKPVSDPLGHQCGK